MLSIQAEKREIKGKKTKNLMQQGILVGILYGPKIKNINIQLKLKDFEKAYKEAGESSLISLKIGNDKYSVLIYELKRDPITGNPVHVDFYQPILTKEVSTWVPLVFEGESLAVKDLGGTLIKETQEIEVRALPEKLPHEIKVNISRLNTFEDEILVKDLDLPEGVKVEKDPDDIIALVTPPQKEEELEKPAEEEAAKVEGVEKEEKPQKEEATEMPADNKEK